MLFDNEKFRIVFLFFYSKNRSERTKSCIFFWIIEIRKKKRRRKKSL